MPLQFKPPPTWANVAHNQEFLSVAIFHPMARELVASAQGVLQAGAHIAAASSTAGSKWSLLAAPAGRPRTTEAFDGSAMFI